MLILKLLSSQLINLNELRQFRVQNHISFLFFTLLVVSSPVTVIFVFFVRCLTIVVRFFVLAFLDD